MTRLLTNDIVDAPAFISLAQAARKVGISTAVAKRLGEEGKFPAYHQIGAKRMISRRCLELWLRERAAA